MNQFIARLYFTHNSFHLTCNMLCLFARSDKTWEFMGRPICWAPTVTMTINDCISKLFKSFANFYRRIPLHHKGILVNLLPLLHMIDWRSALVKEIFASFALLHIAFDLTSSETTAFPIIDQRTPLHIIYNYWIKTLYWFEMLSWAISK